MVIGKSGSNRVPRQPVRVLPQRGAECAQSVRATRPEAGIPAQPVWRDARRTDPDTTRRSSSRTGRARGCAPASRGSAWFRRWRSGRESSPSRFSIPATSPRTQFPNNTIPPTASIRIGQPGSAALPAAERRRREQFRPHRHRARQSGSGRFPGRPLLRREASRLRTLHILPRRRHSGHSLAGRKRKPDVRSDRARDHARRRVRRRLQLGALAFGAEPVPGRLFQARSQPDARCRMAESPCRVCRRIPSRRCCRSSPSPDFQQIGPTTAANSNFTTSITEFLDTFTLVRGRHTIKFGADHPARGSGCSEPAESHRIVRLHHHRHQQFHALREAAMRWPRCCWGR